MWVLRLPARMSSLAFIEEGETASQNRQKCLNVFSNCVNTRIQIVTLGLSHGSS